VFEGKIAIFVFRVNVCGGKGAVIKDGKRGDVTGGAKGLGTFH
jgi:hypothetical protein